MGLSIADALIIRQIKKLLEENNRLLKEQTMLISEGKGKGFY